MQLIGMRDSPYVRRVAVSLKLMGVQFEHQAVWCSAITNASARSTRWPRRRRWPATTAEARREALRLAGLSLAACEKCVQIVYEKEQRPAQADAALREPERAASDGWPWLQGDRLNASDGVLACTWRFSQHYDAVEVPAAYYPAIVRHSQGAEALPEFASTPLD